jgi:hypothetical protein
MAAPDQLRTVITAGAFRPFVVKPERGQWFAVKHP